MTHLHTPKSRYTRQSCFAHDWSSYGRLSIAQGLLVKPSLDVHGYAADMKESVLARYDDLDLTNQREIAGAFAAWVTLG